MIFRSTLSYAQVTGASNICTNALRLPYICRTIYSEHSYVSINNKVPIYLLMHQPMYGSRQCRTTHFHFQDARLSHVPGRHVSTSTQVFVFPPNTSFFPHGRGKKEDICRKIAL